MAERTVRLLQLISISHQRNEFPKLPRFCLYPQTLVLKFAPGHCRIRKIQVLFHHFKIPTKIEFFIGTTNTLRHSISQQTLRQRRHISTPNLFRKSNNYPWNEGESDSFGNDLGELNGRQNITDPITLNNTPDNVQYTKLGFVTLNDNSQTGYKARELKSVHVDAEGTYLRISISKCHINALNLYNQVGIIAINVIGEICDSEYLIRQFGESDLVGRMLIGLDPLEADPEVPQIPPHDNNNAAYFGLLEKSNFDQNAQHNSIQDLTFDIYHDREIASLISTVIKAKDDAINREKFPLAKALKTFFELCKKAGAEIARLEVAKHHSIQQEDYDTANAIKHDVELIRAALKAKMDDLGLVQLPNGIIISNDDPEHLLYLQSLAANNREVTIDRPESSYVIAPQIPPPTTIHVPITSHFPPVPAATQPKQPEPPLPPSIPFTKPESPKLLNGDLKKSKVDSSVATSQSLFTTVKPKRFPPELEDPEILTPSQIEQNDACIATYGMFIVQCLLSRQFKLREWAMTEVSKCIEEWNTHYEKLEKGEMKEEDEGLNKKFKGGEKEREKGKSFVDKETFVAGSISVVKIGLNDAREKSATLSVALWDQITRVSIARRIPTAVVFRNYETLLPLLLTRACDMNTRIKQACSNLVITLTIAYGKQPHGVFRYLLQPIAMPQPSTAQSVRKSKSVPNGLGANATTGTHVRLIKGRLEIVEKVLKEFKFDDLKEIERSPSVKQKKGVKESTHQSGLSVETVMTFVSPFLSHPDVDVRDLAINIVVKVLLEWFASMSLSENQHVNEIPPIIVKYLSGVREQVIQHILDRLNERRGVVVKRIRKPRVQPWQEKSTKGSKSNAHSRQNTRIEKTAESEEEDNASTMEKLKEEVEELRDLVAAVSHTQEIPHENKKINGPKRDEVDREQPQTQDLQNEDLDESEKYCIFCGDYDPDFTEESLDVHYWEECPYLTICPLCNLITEIPTLTSHMLSACDNKKKVRQCTRCNEAVIQEEFENHMRKKFCKPASKSRTVSRCPLCHKDIQDATESPESAGWKNHLLSNNGCTSNNRKPKLNFSDKTVKQSEELEVTKNLDSKKTMLNQEQSSKSSEAYGI
ncbi:hypothetical protein HK098_003706 [Nowakowskiella sp. JEL0407]|nr:hypothetical protein HK098_003706 [Nowakowskiella sp. JEL0407]